MRQANEFYASEEHALAIPFVSYFVFIAPHILLCIPLYIIVVVDDAATFRAVSMLTNKSPQLYFRIPSPCQDYLNLLNLISLLWHA